MYVVFMSEFECEIVSLIPPPTGTSISRATQSLRDAENEAQNLATSLESRGIEARA